jgi:hypothetical protein
MAADAMISVTMCSQAARMRLMMNIRRSLCMRSLSFTLNGEERKSSVARTVVERSGSEF